MTVSFHRPRLGVDHARHLSPVPSSDSDSGISPCQPAYPPEGTRPDSELREEGSDLLSALSSAPDPYRLACQFIEESYEQELALVRAQVTYLESRLSKYEGETR